MVKKMIVLNASPRINKNTATLLKEAQRGAEAAGAEVEYADLVKLNYKGCMSCFACKRKGNTCNGLCAHEDELRPLLKRILDADALIVGTPVYYSYPTGMFRNLMERLMFPILSYNTDGKGGMMKYRDKKLATGLIYTMNCTEDFYNRLNYPVILGPDRNYLAYYFGSCEVLNSFNTWQFSDYSLYDASAVDLSAKQWSRDNQFPKDKQAAYDMGKRLAGGTE